MNNKHVYVLALLLAIAGLLIFSFKNLQLGIPLVPGEMSKAWQLERRIEFIADDGPVRLVIKMPASSIDMVVERERIVAGRYSVVRGSLGDNQYAKMATRSASGLQVVYLNTIVHQRRIQSEPVSAPPPVQMQPLMTDAQLLAASNLLEIAQERSADDETLVSALILSMHLESVADKVRALTGEDRSSASEADATIATLALRGLAARRVNGVMLGGWRSTANPVHWIEVYLGSRWVPFSLQTGESAVPDSYFAIWRGSMPMVDVYGGSSPRITFSVKPLSQRALEQMGAMELPAGRLFARLSFDNLPLAVQQAYHLLFAAPVGILALVLIRNVLGFKTLGTFMPVLIALMLLRTGLLWGGLLFVGIVTAGLVFRLYLERLKLLLVPRLASVLVFVIILIGFLGIAMHEMSIAQGLSITFFPMVIMTMAIERMSILWDERGAAAAMKQGIVSLIVAVLLAMLMSIPLIKHLFYSFPELLLVILATTLVLGRYTGYRLSELWRFRMISASEPLEIAPRIDPDH